MSTTLTRIIKLPVNSLSLLFFQNYTSFEISLYFHILENMNEKNIIALDVFEIVKTFSIKTDMVRTAVSRMQEKGLIYVVKNYNDRIGIIINPCYAYSCSVDKLTDIINTWNRYQEKRDRTEKVFFIQVKKRQ